jgi:hypothetical protein
MKSMGCQVNIKFNIQTIPTIVYTNVFCGARYAAKKCCRRLLAFKKRDCLQHFLAAQRVAAVFFLLNF